MASRPSFVALAVVLTLVAGCGWWLWSARPSASDVAGLRTSLPTLPPLDLAALDAAATSQRQIHGPLPLVVEPNSTGRDDPFAGT